MIQTLSSLIGWTFLKCPRCLSHHTAFGASVFVQRLSSFPYPLSQLGTQQQRKSNNVVVGDKKKKLFTPGPLCVSPSVRAALDRDLGSRDKEFISIVKSVRDELILVAGLSPEKYTSVLMQGSGTFAVESVLQSTSDRTKKVLILASGSYGRRMAEICLKADLPHTLIDFPENEAVDVGEVRRVVQSGVWGSVCVVHCETTSGVLNPIDEIGHAVKSLLGPESIYIVDAMSSFGGVVADFSTADFVISSANKCLQGVPGFAFVLADTNKLKQCQGRSVSLSLDLFEQWRGLETQGQFRFTPPTHAILGLAAALEELQNEGGVAGRAARYVENNRIVKKRLGSLGFKQFVRDEDDCHIITSFKYPNHPAWNFDQFYERLSSKGQLIYPGKVTNANCFRIGNIGHLFPQDMEYLGDCIVQVLEELGIPIPVS